ncbi:hypothetical protein MLD38_000552 [Melastoma candidum]|uniref:Uncharacterized protein n=1 Tax=Melastoma candidum TaxID=119954 RepID=A0ACB9SAK2_9MYRT|nr:hypothetical protein MLD38_000552 [Melastoma candidum]
MYLQVEEFVNAVEVEDRNVVHGGAVKAPKVLADIVESVAGAVYVDINFDLQRLWVIFRGLLEPIVTHEDLQQQPQPVALLLMQCQRKGQVVEIKQWKDGSENVASIHVDDQLVASGSSAQKDIAKLNAAKLALEKLGRDEPFKTEDVEMDEINGSFQIENAKQKLKELSRKRRWMKPIYSNEKALGPAHGRKYVCSVQIQTPEGSLFMMGEEKKKLKDAENSAASMMICALQEHTF